MMKSILTLLLIWLISVGVVYSQDPPDPISSDTFSTTVDVFEVPDPMDITLTYDMKAFQRDKNKDEYRDVHFLYQFSDSIAIEHTLRIKPRGQFCLTGTAPVQGTTVIQQYRTGGCMNGAIHTPATQQTAIGRVNNGIHFERCNIGANNFNHGSKTV